jgi:hypothetical protein
MTVNDEFRKVWMRRMACLKKHRGPKRTTRDLSIVDSKSRIPGFEAGA